MSVWGVWREGRPGTETGKETCDGRQGLLKASSHLTQGMATYLWGRVLVGEKTVKV
jgi:hypothetical protein